MKAKRHLNTTREEETKTVHPWEDYHCVLSMKMKPVNEAWLDKFSLDWIEHARTNQGYINIWSYPVITVGLSITTVQTWMKKHENVLKAHKYVKNICGVRRDTGASSRELDSTWISKTMPLYCDDFKDLETWRANLKSEVESGPKNITVLMQPYPKTDIVPEKK